MEIIEKFTRSKTGQEQFNEDCYFIGNNFVVVADGTTSKANNLPVESDGRFVSHFVCECFKIISSKLEPKSILNTINELLSKELCAKNLNSDYASCCLLVYNAERKELFSYGDCRYRIKNKEYGFNKKDDIELSKIRAKINKKALNEGMTINQITENDIGRNFILDKLKANVKNANKPGEHGYPVINGKGILEEYISVKKIDDGETIILSSDGYPKLLSTLKKTEKYLNKILEEDPLCINKFISTKGIKSGNESFDDRTYIRIKT